jgi:hypothetical protein
MQDISVRRRQANLGIILSSPLADSNLDSWSINFQPQTPITDNPCGEELKTRRSIKDYHLDAGLTLNRYPYGHLRHSLSFDAEPHNLPGTALHSNRVGLLEYTRRPPLFVARLAENTASHVGIFVSVASSSQASFFAAHLTSHSFFYWLWLLGDPKASSPTEIQTSSAFLSS